MISAHGTDRRLWYACEAPRVHAWCVGMPRVRGLRPPSVQPGVRIAARARCRRDDARHWRSDALSQGLGWGDDFPTARPFLPHGRKCSPSAGGRRVADRRPRGSAVAPRPPAMGGETRLGAGARQPSASAGWCTAARRLGWSSGVGPHAHADHATSTRTPRSAMSASRGADVRGLPRSGAAAKGPFLDPGDRPGSRNLLRRASRRHRAVRRRGRP